MEAGQTKSIELKGCRLLVRKVGTEMVIGVPNFSWRAFSITYFVL